MINPSETYTNFCNDLLAWKRDDCPMHRAVPFTVYAGLCWNLLNWMKYNKYTKGEQSAVYNYQHQLFNALAYPFGDWQTFAQEKREGTIFNNVDRIAHIKKYSSNPNQTN